jgi:hypothetical protein
MFSFKQTSARPLLPMCTISSPLKYPATIIASTKPYKFFSRQGRGFLFFLVLNKKLLSKTTLDAYEL